MRGIGRSVDGMLRWRGWPRGRSLEVGLRRGSGEFSGVCWVGCQDLLRGMSSGDVHVADGHCIGSDVIIGWTLLDVLARHAR